MPSGTINALLELYREGGILVCTSSDIPGGDHGRSSGGIVARTLIQPDGDVVTKISERIHVQHGLWENHLSSVRHKILWLRLLRRTVKGLQLFSVVPLLYGVQHFFAWQIKVAAISLLVCVILVAFRPVVLFSFQRILRRRFPS
jgi:hypothetical protein